MISSIDHLIIAVKDINDAEENYRKIFGMEPVWKGEHKELCLLYTSPSPRDAYVSRMPSSA